MTEFLQYKSDNSESKNNYLEIDLGWDDPTAKLRLTHVHVPDNNVGSTIRLQRSLNGKLDHGPQIEIKCILDLGI